MNEEVSDAAVGQIICVCSEVLSPHQPFTPNAAWLESTWSSRFPDMEL